MSRGRPQEPGEVFRLRLRWRPGDDPALLEFLRSLSQADTWLREKMIKNALTGGLAGQSQQTSQQQAEDQETAGLLDNLLNGQW